MADGKEWHTDIDLGYIVTRYREVAIGVVDDAVDAVAKASDRAIPVRTGKTRASRSTGRDGTTGWVAYNSRKAVPLHENLGKRHRRGRAKFLETTLAAQAERTRVRALAAFRAATQGK